MEKACKIREMSSNLLEKGNKNAYSVEKKKQIICKKSEGIVFIVTHLAGWPNAVAREQELYCYSFI